MPRLSHTHACVGCSCAAYDVDQLTVRVRTILSACAGRAQTDHTRRVRCCCVCDVLLCCVVWGCVFVYCLLLLPLCIVCVMLAHAKCTCSHQQTGDDLEIPLERPHS